MMYSAFTSAAMRCNLENMESVRLALNNRVRVAMWLFHSFVVPVSVGLLAVLLTSYGSGCSTVGTWTDMRETLSWESFFPHRADLRDGVAAPSFFPHIGF